jgi:iron complex outermembrane receptor protein
MPTSIPLRTSAIVCVVATSAGFAQAQDSAGDSAASPQTLPTVTVRASADASRDGLKAPYAGGQVARGGRVGLLGSQDVMATPFTVTNFTQELIQNQQAASVGDVLQNDPAVRVARGFGNYQQLYIVRGLPVYSDDMSYNGLYGLLPRQYLAAELLERVEVLRGASAFLNGAAPGGSGLGGAINVVPKRAPNQALTQATLGLESGGQAYAAVDIARRFGPDKHTGIRLNAVRRDGDTALDGESRELNVFSLGADYRRGDLRVSADLGYQDHRMKASQPSITIAPGLPVPDAPDAAKNIAQPWTYSNERDTFGTLRAEYDIAPDLTAWGAFGARHGDESTDLLNPTVIDAAGNTTGFRFLGTRTDRVSTGEVGLRGKLRTGSVGHAWSASVSTFHAKMNAPYGFSAFGPAFLGTVPSNIYTPLSSTPLPATALVGTTVENTRTSSAAVADTLSWLDDTVLLTLGARWQRIHAGSYDEHRVTPVAGLVVKASPSVSLFANYVEGLVKGDVAPAVSGTQPVSNAGEVFAPYVTRQTELGVKLDTGRFGGSLSVFSARKPLYSVNTATLHFERTDRQSNRGAELSIYGEPIVGLRLLGGASVLDTDVGGQDAIGAPKSQFNLGAEWDLPMVRGLSLNARAVHTAAQYADAANTQTLPAWSRLDIGARYVFDWNRQQVTVRARIDNLTNRSYWASAGGYPGAGYLVLGAPRTAVVSAAVDF